MIHEYSLKYSIQVSTPIRHKLISWLDNLASALEKARVWPNGVEAPDPVVVPIATSIKGVTDDLLVLLNDEKQPLLSKVVKTL